MILPVLLAVFPCPGITVSSRLTPELDRLVKEVILPLHPRAGDRGGLAQVAVSHEDLPVRLYALLALGQLERLEAAVDELEGRDLVRVLDVLACSPSQEKGGRRNRREGRGGTGPRDSRRVRTIRGKMGGDEWGKEEQEQMGGRDERRKGRRRSRLHL
eukprot:767858-Hanusia_phi.AAC.10